MICLFESRNQKETKTTYNVHEGQASINGGHAKEKGKKNRRRKNSSAIKQREKGRRHREGKLMGPRSYGISILKSRK